MSSTSVRYRKVATTEEDDDAQEARKKARAEMIEKVSVKLQAVFWVLVSGAILFYTDLPKKCMEDPRINRLFLNLAVGCLAVNSVLVGYLTIYVPYQERLLSKKLGKTKKLEWEVYCPRVIPTMTAFGLTFFVCAAKAIWPVYGLLTPLMLLVLFIGFIFSTNFMPYFG